MFEYKDYASEEEVPTDVVALSRDKAGRIRTISQQQAEERFTKYGLKYGESSPQAIQQTQKLFTGLGISTEPSQNSVPAGVASNGSQLFSNRAFAQSKDAAAGKALNETAYKNFSPAKVFNDDEAKRFQQIGNYAADPSLLTKLDNAKANGDMYAFRDSVNKTVGAMPTKDSHGSDYTSSELFDNWHNLSTGQKSLALAGLGHQNFKFDDGATMQTKKVTPDVLDVRGMTPKDVADLDGAGINPYPVVKHWDEMIMLQQRQFNPRSSISLARNAARLKLLGQGENGQAAGVTKETLEKLGAQAEPHMGVGAISIPIDQTPPSDYVKIGSANGRTQIIPKQHVTTAITGTEGSIANAQQVYRKWGAPPTKDANNGIVGGNQMLAGTMSMIDTNPHAVSSAVTAKTARYTREATSQRAAAAQEEDAQRAQQPQPTIVQQVQGFINQAAKGAIAAKKIGSLINEGASLVSGGSSAAVAGGAEGAAALSAPVATSVSGGTLAAGGAASSAVAAEAGSATLTAAAGGQAVGSSIGGGTLLAGGGSTTAAPVATSVNGGTVLADGTVVGGSAGTGAQIAAGASYLAAAYGAYVLTDMALNGGNVHTSDTGSLTVQGAAAGAAVGSVVPGVGTLIGAVVGGALGAGIGLTASNKGQRQNIRDQYREAVIENGSPLFGKDYKGKLVGGTEFDFGKDKFSFDEGKGNGNGNIDLSTAAGAKAASYGNVIAAVQGITNKGKAREAIATQFAAAALGEGDIRVEENAAHMLKQIGIKDGSEVQALLNKAAGEKTISEDEYRAFSNAARELLPSAKDSKVRELTPAELAEVRGDKPPTQSGQPAADAPKQITRNSNQKTVAFDAMVQHTANVLVTGDPKKNVELDHEAQDITDKNYKEQFKIIRSSYAKQGVSSKQMGLHLINQAYAEGRISELEYTSSHTTMQAVFDDDKNLYDSMTSASGTGRRYYQRRKDAGVE